MALSPALQKLVAAGANKFSRSSGERIKPKEGVNRYRILLPDPNAQFWAELGVHWIKAEENGKPFAVVGCSDVVYGTPCAIDTAIDEAIKNAFDEESKKLYQSWRAKKTVLLNVLDRSKGSADHDKVQILEVTAGTFGSILNIVQEYANEGEDILDASAGIDISITRSGVGLNTEYTVNTAPGKSAPVTKAHLSSCHDLQQHIAREFFKGEEQKALTFIGQTAQINVPRLASKTPTAALTSRAAQVSTPTVDEDDIADQSQAEEVEEAAPVKPVKAAAASKPAPAPAPEPEEEEVAAAVDDGDLEDVLADLDNL